MVLLGFHLGAGRSACGALRQAKQGPHVVPHAQASRPRLGLYQHHLGAVDLRAESLAGECQWKRGRHLQIVAPLGPGQPPSIPGILSMQS